MTNEQFRSVVEQYERLVYTICYQLVQDHQEAQNLTQETFLSAYTHIDRCDPANLKPWIARIATNKAKDHLKSAYLRRVECMPVPDMEPALTLESSPDDIYLVKEGEKAIQDQIYQLNEPYLNVAVLFFLEEKNVDEIARALHRPKKTVQTQIYRAKIILQNKLREGT